MNVFHVSGFGYLLSETLELFCPHFLTGDSYFCLVKHCIFQLTYISSFGTMEPIFLWPWSPVVIFCWKRTGNEFPRCLWGRAYLLSSSLLLSWENLPCSSWDNQGNIFASFCHLILQMYDLWELMFEVSKQYWSISSFREIYRFLARLLTPNMAKSKNHTNHNQGLYFSCIAVVMYWKRVKDTMLFFFYFNVLHLISRPQMAPKRD